MANVNFTGIPALAWGVGFVVIGAAPVWLAAKITGAGNATLMRSIISLVIGAVCGLIGLSIGGPFAILLAPIAFLLSFKFVLDTSILGSVILGCLAMAGYFVMAKFIGGSFSITN
jgi:hypothetical protein